MTSNIRFKIKKISCFDNFMTSRVIKNYNVILVNRCLNYKIKCCDSNNKLKIIEMRNFYSVQKHNKIIELDKSIISAEKKETQIIKNVDTGLIKITTENKNLVDKDKVKIKSVNKLFTKIKHEVLHYWNGTKLLGYECKVASKLLIKLIAGYNLSRRESNHLQKTITDLARLIPFSMFIIIPFAEFLLPFALKIFPNLLPSTYESSFDKTKKIKLLSDKRKIASEYIKSTIEKSGLNFQKQFTIDEKKSFVLFFDKITLGEKPSNEQLICVAGMFKNDNILDNLSRLQLVAMTKYMSLRPFGTNSLLRYLIRHRLMTIIKDDKEISYEGVKSLTFSELETSCLQRGIKTSNKTIEMLQNDLSAWLDLRLNKKIPSSLLILSSLYTYNDSSNPVDSYYDSLLSVLSSIPDDIYNTVKLELSNDAKLKLDVLKKEEELIKEENKKDIVSNNNIVDTFDIDELESKSRDIYSKK